jgi:hypothetical protein
MSDARQGKDFRKFEIWGCQSLDVCAMLSCCHLERWLSGRKRQIANLLRVLSPFGGSNPPLSVLYEMLHHSQQTL